jgi:hypothetical protein
MLHRWPGRRSRHSPVPGRTVDAVTPLETFVDGGTAYDLNYGAFIGAPITQALAPYIDGRVNDDTVESHRVEIYPLPMAANQSKVTFRFMQAGTGASTTSAYIFHSAVSSSPALSISAVGGSVTISWPSAFTGFTLENTDSLTAPSWSTVNGVANNSVTITIGAGNKFYRPAPVTIV